MIVLSLTLIMAINTVIRIHMDVQMIEYVPIKVNLYVQDT